MSVVVVLELGSSAGASSVLHMSAELTNLPPSLYYPSDEIYSSYHEDFTPEGEQIEEALRPLEHFVEYGRRSVALSHLIVDSMAMRDVLEEISVIFGGNLTFTTIAKDIRSIEPRLIRNPDQIEIQSNIMRVRREMIRHRNRLIVDATQHSIDARGASVANK